MGCCCSKCCCVPDVPKVHGDRPGPYARPDFELKDTIESTDSNGPPPPYDDGGEQNFPDAIAGKPEPSILPASTTLYGDKGQRVVRFGVRSRDHSLYCAAAGGHLEEVKRLLESGFNPSDRTVFDWCPLHWAAHNDIKDGHEIVKLLVEYGADLNQLSDTGVTPLDLARTANRHDNIRFLESMGAKSGVEVKRENTAKYQGRGLDHHFASLAMNAGR